jgi:hypothetical protein
VAARSRRQTPAASERPWLMLLLVPLFLSMPVLVGIRRRQDEAD